MKEYETCYLNVNEIQTKKDKKAINLKLKNLWFIASKDTKKGITTIIFKRYI